MAARQRRRLEIDDAVRLQMSVRRIEESEIEFVVNNPDVEEPILRRSGRALQGRFRYRGSPRPGRKLEVECLLRADNGMYRVISVREV